ncbi:MAG: tRNA (cytosine(32)/uridine(32)-2'-O)-methyltransferase TrmJ [Gemmatimonadaceae bacterium]|nr:tRNA (cytosine(32)/uridine(32)-2'-O)-methyltransferase TrmJ [Gemmatimonadaceae bacterium]
MSDHPLANVVVVLDEPQDPVNIAATVRAMKNMGAATLRLVRPVEYDPTRIERVAHGTQDIVANIRHFDALDDALADCVRVAGFTARRRAAKWRTATAREVAPELLDAATTGPVALLFGREDRGLSNDALDRATVVVTIPTTDHASLNLAQAVLVALYELHVAAPNASRTLAPPRKDAPPATAAQYERCFADLARALDAIHFFRTRNPELIMRTVRSLTMRAAPDAREIELVRAMAMEVLRALARRGDRP